MEVKEMRERLKDVVETIPRSNEAVIALYNEKFGETAVDEPTKLTVVAADNEYTYVGSGDTPPQIIKFMGRQVFTRGKLTTVTDPIVLEKVKTNKSFRKGPVEGEEMYEQDEKARLLVEMKREEDLKIQIAVERENRKAG